MTATIASRIENLNRKLQGIAHKYQVPGMETDDVFQAMIEALLQHSTEDPAFVEQTDAYLCQYAKWQASHLLEKVQIYNKWVDEEKVSDDADDDDEFGFEFITETPEDIVEEREARAEMIKVIATLPTENQKIIQLLSIGYTKAEIADELGVSRPAISQRLAAIKQALQAFVTPDYLSSPAFI